MGPSAATEEAKGGEGTMPTEASEDTAQAAALPAAETEEGEVVETPWVTPGEFVLPAVFEDAVGAHSMGIINPAKRKIVFVPAGEQRKNGLLPVISTEAFKQDPTGFPAFALIGPLAEREYPLPPELVAVPDALVKEVQDIFCARRDPGLTAGEQKVMIRQEAAKHIGNTLHSWVGAMTLLAEDYRRQTEADLDRYEAAVQPLVASSCPMIEATVRTSVGLARRMIAADAEVSQLLCAYLERYIDSLSGLELSEMAEFFDQERGQVRAGLGESLRLASREIGQADLLTHRLAAECREGEAAALAPHITPALTLFRAALS